MAGIDLGDAWADNVWESGVWADGVWAGQESSSPAGGVLAPNDWTDPNRTTRTAGMIGRLITGLGIVILLIMGVR
jgi:hypothetical protein